MTLLEAVNRHIDNTGTGLELDDVMSNGRYPKELTDQLYDLAKKYRTDRYPIGLSNPDSFSDLLLLAQQWESRLNCTQFNYNYGAITNYGDSALISQIQKQPRFACPTAPPL